MAQAVRDEQYKRYYYAMMKKMFATMIDVNDYHSYEAFVLNAGGTFFYLQNQDLQNRYPDLMDIIDDLVMYSVLKLKKAPLFNTYYNEETLIKHVLDGKLHPLFQEWCEEFYEGAYKEWVLDEYAIPKKDCPNVRKLASLMLLDLGLVELTNPSDAIVLARLKSKNLNHTPAAPRGDTKPTNFPPVIRPAATPERPANQPAEPAHAHTSRTAPDFTI